MTRCGYFWEKMAIFFCYFKDILVIFDTLKHFGDIFYFWLFSTIFEKSHLVTLPKGLASSILIQKIMTSLQLPPDAVAKMILLEKSLYDSGTSPQDIVHLLQAIADNEKNNLLICEPLLKQSLSSGADSDGVLVTCDLVDAFRGARVAPELTSKIILLQKGT